MRWERERGKGGEEEGTWNDVAVHSVFWCGFVLFLSYLSIYPALVIHFVFHRIGMQTALEFFWQIAKLTLTAFWFDAFVNWKIQTKKEWTFLLYNKERCVNCSGNVWMMFARAKLWTRRAKWWWGRLAILQTRVEMQFSYTLWTHLSNQCTKLNREGQTMCI